MEFEFTESFWVDERDIKEMKKKIQKGENPVEVFQDWACGLDDSDYYVVNYVRDQILECITEGANPNA